MNLVRNSAGNIGLGLMLGMFALGVAGGAYFLLAGGKSENAADNSGRVLFEEMKARVGQVMGRADVMAVSVDRNPNSFGCLSTATAACAGQGGLFLLYDSKQASAAMSQLVRGTGLSGEGAGCRNFPSPACPVRVETQWQPVCGGGRCEGTRSFSVHATVVFDDGTAPAERWEQKGNFSPEIRVSQAVSCERGGGIWAGTECISHDQAAQRRVASSARGGDDISERFQERENAVNAAAAPMSDSGKIVYVCPDAMPIQGELYTVERISDDRGQVQAAAMNGCPGVDRFVFSCQQKMPAQFELEGQWVQIDAQMQPDCGGGMQLAPPAGAEQGNFRQ